MQHNQLSEIPSGNSAKLSMCKQFWNGCTLFNWASCTLHCNIMGCLHMAGIQNLRKLRRLNLVSNKSLRCITSYIITTNNHSPQGPQLPTASNSPRLESLPEELGKVKSLKVLQVDDNRLEYIPSSLKPIWLEGPTFQKNSKPI